MGSAHPLTKLHSEILPRATQRALNYLCRQKWLIKTQWYLAGGTALTLQVGHRQSVDLDFFTPRADFSQGKLLSHFPKSDWQSTLIREGTIYGQLLGAKVSFIAYPFFKNKEKLLPYGAVRILTPRDIAVMKIIAVSQRGKKRDFIDLYWYAHHVESLRDVLLRVPHQYQTVTHDFHHILKSLMYFTDAEADPMPEVFFDVTWERVKRYFQAEVPRLTKQLIHLI